MGAVYEALDERLDATVALKETLFTDERLRKQFEREARLLARLHHPALPRVSDHFAEGGGEFLVMQFIPGDDLGATMAQRRGPFPAEQVILWADQLLDALDYLHTQDPQIVHRDIKPQNLKLTGRGQVVLLDFGLAKGQVHEWSRVTASASIFGYTPNYAPLEQVQGQGTDPRSDLYALAATLYHLVTGTKPPDALTRAAAMVNGEADPLEPANQLNTSVRPDFAGVLKRALAQGRDQRYASAAEMRKALHSGSEATVGLNSDAATVLFPAGQTQVSPAVPTVPAQPTVATGETTVVQPVPPPVAAKRSVLPWAIAGALMLVIVAGAGAFYAFEKRRSLEAAAQPTPTPIPIISLQIAKPSPTPAEAQHEDEAKEAKIESEKAKAEKERIEKEKSEKAAREAKKEAKKKDKTAADADDDESGDEDRSRDKNRGDTGHPEAPKPPDYNGDNTPPNERGRRRPPNVRVFPDGRKIILMPDGTRIMTFPDGSSKILPGRRPRQRP
jgi:serine/threonine protein kinase